MFLDAYKTLLPERGVFILALLLGIIFWIPAFAGMTDDNTVDIGEIHVSGRQQYESLEQQGSFTTIITPDKFDKQTKSLGEILKESAGVDVKYTGGEGQITTVSIRGSSAEQVAVFLDGVRLNSSTFGSVDFSTIPIDAIERIEVIRGASSARFGSDAMGGVINIVTKKAGAKRAIDLKLTGGSFHTLKTSESWREPGDGYDLVLAHSHRSTGGDFTFRSARLTLSGQPVGPTRTYTRLHDKSIAEDVLAKVTFDITEKIHLSLASDFFWTDRQVPGTEEETTLLYPTNPLEANEEIFRDTASLVYLMDEFFIDALSFETGVMYFINHDHFTDPSPAVGNPIDVSYLNQAPEWHIQWMHIASRKYFDLTSTFRYQYKYDYSRDSSPRAGANLMGTRTRHTNALLIEEVIAFFDERLIISPQTRFEKATGRKIGQSFRVGTTIKPTEWLHIKGNIGKAFRYPNFGELYYPDQGYLRGNPDLDDEKAWGLDAGFILHPEYVSLEVSYFQNRISNMILFVPISATTIMPVNTFKAFSQGVEVQATFDPIKYIHIRGNYTWQDTHYQGSSRRLPGRPEHKANIYVEGRIEPVTLFTEVHVTGTYPVNTGNTVWISDNTSVDAGATLKFAKHFFTTAEVKDIGNVQRYDRLAFPLPRRSYWVTIGAKI